jgi:hypothetical protein
VSPLHLRFSERHVGLVSDSKYSARHSLKCRRNGVGVFLSPALSFLVQRIFGPAAQMQIGYQGD